MRIYGLHENVKESEVLGFCHFPTMQDPGSSRHQVSGSGPLKNAMIWSQKRKSGQGLDHVFPKIAKIFRKFVKKKNLKK
jgi:hypothetical protein